MVDTRAIHRKIEAKLKQFLVECDARECRVVREVQAKESRKCGPSCSCSPCSTKRESKPRPFGGDRHLAQKAGRFLGSAIGRARKLLKESGPGDGMQPTGGQTPELPEPSDGRLDPEEVNFRYAQDQSRSCATCRHFQPTDPEEYGGSCELVVGMIRGVDTCDAWEAKDEPEAAFDQEYGS